MTGSPAAQTNGSGRGMLLRFLVLGGLLLTSQGMAVAQDPLPYTSLKAYIVDLKGINPAARGTREWRLY
jgi:hypothetical protein